MAYVRLLDHGQRGMSRLMMGMILVGFVAASLLAMSLSAGASTPVGQGPTCVLPPVDRELLRDIQAELAASPPVPATPFPDGVSGEPHSMPFPPPPGDAIDDATFLEVIGFFDALQVCINVGDFEAVYGTLTRDRWLRVVNGDAASIAETMRTLDAGTAPPSAEPVSRIDIVAAWRLEDESVVAVTRWLPDEEWITIVLIETAAGWKIDDQWTGQGQSLVEPATPETTAIVPNPPDSMP